MRLLTVSVLTVLISIAAMGDERTVFDESDVWKLYSRLEAKFTEFDGESAQLGGVTVGTLLNERIGFALSAYTLLNSITLEHSDFEDIDSFDLWLGGVLIDYTFAPRDLIHLNMGVLLGGGRIEAKARTTGKRESEDFALVEPGLNLLVNLTKTIEFGIGVSYRFVDGYDRAGVDDSDMSGVAGSVFLRLTEF
jgi:hypothetical protein